MKAKKAPYKEGDIIYVNYALMKMLVEVSSVQWTGGKITDWVVFPKRILQTKRKLRGYMLPFPLGNEHRPATEEESKIFFDFYQDLQEKSEKARQYKKGDVIHVLIDGKPHLVEVRNVIFYEYSSVVESVLTLRLSDKKAAYLIRINLNEDHRPATIKERTLLMVYKITHWKQHRGWINFYKNSSSNYNDI